MRCNKLGTRQVATVKASRCGGERGSGLVPAHKMRQHNFGDERTRLHLVLCCEAMDVASQTFHPNGSHPHWRETVELAACKQRLLLLEHLEGVHLSPFIQRHARCLARLPLLGKRDQRQHDHDQAFGFQVCSSGRGGRRQEPLRPPQRHSFPPQLVHRRMR